MGEFFFKLFDHSDFLPRPACGGWTDGLMVLHNASDIAIGLSYMAIPCLLAFFTRRRRDVPFRHLFWLFGAFIIACGFTHFFELLMFYVPHYRLSGLVKLATAAVSVATVVALVPVLPKALALRSSDELEREIVQRKRAEAEIRRLNEDMEVRVRARTEELERQVAERARAEAQLRLVIESAPNAMVMSDARGAITLANAHAETLFGYRREELIGQSVEWLVPERFRGHHPAFRAEFHTRPEARAMGAGRDLYALKKNRDEVPVEIGLNPIETEQGIAVLSVIVDITARKKAEAALEAHARDLARSNEELEQFAYVASHDLREPLRMVSSFVQLLDQRYGDRLDDDAREFIRFAVDGALRMQALIDDLLTFSRVGTRGNPFVPTDMKQVIDQVLRDLQLAIADSGTEIVHKSLPTVMADETQMVQLFENLIANAIKFHSARQPRICISAEKKADAWEFAIEDNGIGIDPKFAARIFEIFQRLHTREEYPGTGIGLAVCKKIVERHGGRIWVASQPGQGATFYFTLPDRSVS